MLYPLQVKKCLLHIPPQLLFRNITLIGINRKAHKEKVSVTAPNRPDLTQPPMIQRIRIITMYLSGNIPLLTLLVALNHNTLVPLRVSLSCFGSRHFRRSERLIYIHPVFRLRVGVQIVQGHRLSGTKRHQLCAVFCIDRTDHTETLID